MNAQLSGDMNPSPAACIAYAVALESRPQAARQEGSTLKTVYVLRRKEGMSLEEFQKYWLETHGPLVRKHAATLGIQRYIQVHTRPPATPQPPSPLRGQMLEPFDGVAELWSDPDKASGTPDERRESGRILAEDEANFIDFARSAIWRGEEKVQIE